MKKHTTSINERARSVLAISRDEYAYCSYVQYRSADPRSVAPGWCCDSKDEVAEFIGMTRQGLYKLIRKMEDLRLIETGARGFQRVTGRWIDTDSECKQSLHQSVNKVDSECKQSLHQSVNKVDAHNKDKVDNKIDEIEREVDEKKSASLTPAPALPDQLETELESYINHVEAKKEKAPQVAPPPPLIVTTHSQPQDGIKITTVEAMNLPSPDAPKFYQPTNPQAAELLMAGLGRKPMAETADEAAALIEAWCKENAETVKSWYSRSKRAFSPDDLTALTIKFCSCYSNHAETGKQTRFMGNPVLFFRNGFSSWLIEQKKYDVVPSDGGATRYNSTPQDQVYKPQSKPGTHQPNFVP